MNLQSTGGDEYDYLLVGSWHEGMLTMDDGKLWINSSEMVRSVCSEPCSRGQIKVRGEGCVRLGWVGVGGWGGGGTYFLTHNLH